jgi:hypothetical protein
MKKEYVLYDKLLYVGFTILDLGKNYYLRFFYTFLKRKYGDKVNPPNSKPIHSGSSKSETESVRLCNRWSKIDNKYIEIQRPSIVKSYNENM